MYLSPISLSFQKNEVGLLRSAHTSHRLCSNYRKPRTPTVLYRTIRCNKSREGTREQCTSLPIQQGSRTVRMKIHPAQAMLYPIAVAGLMFATFVCSLRVSSRLVPLARPPHVPQESDTKSAKTQSLLPKGFGPPHLFQRNKTRKDESLHPVPERSWARAMVLSEARG